MTCTGSPCGPYLQPSTAGTYRPVRGVIFDLDGLLLDTETGIHRITLGICKRFGKEYDPSSGIGMGRLPRDAVADVIKHLSLPIDVDEYMAISTPLCMESFKNVEPLVGAERLVRHLYNHRIPIAIATSSYRDGYERKVSGHAWFECFEGNVVTGDQVLNGKPSPEIFLKASELLSLAPEDCLVFEDAPSGVQAAVAAGNQVIAVACAMLASTMYEPLHPTAIHQSLLEFDPELFEIPAYSDTIHRTVPRDPVMRLQSQVVHGFGRGSKELGIPTANMKTDELLSGLLSCTNCGIYCGWAQVAGGQIHKMVTSIGWNPFFKNEKKTVEPYLMHKFDEDFYGENLKVLICGFVRPEKDFQTLEALIEAIHSDIETATQALEDDKYMCYKQDPFFDEIGE